MPAHRAWELAVGSYSLKGLKGGYGCVCVVFVCVCVCVCGGGSALKLGFHHQVSSLFMPVNRLGVIGKVKQKQSDAK